MHCSANLDDDGRVAIFFGLSGTGKTTLSADPERHLIGDDEHGWSDDGVFNVEGGCYAKVIRLSAEAEPQIYATTRAFGTVLENVVLDERGVLDLDDDSKTENTRAAYKLEQIANALPTKRAGHPSSVVFLTADAFGILPPIARLTRDQAMYWFLSGFTAKLAGTEIGVTEPQPTFSACFGAPFLPQPPSVYAQHARREARRASRREGLARQHGLDGRAVRRGPPHADRRDADAARRRALGRPRRRRVPARPDVRRRGPRRSARASTRRSSTRARHGRTRRRTTRRPPSSPACSARTSRVSTTSLRASRPPAQRFSTTWSPRAALLTQASCSRGYKGRVPSPLTRRFAVLLVRRAPARRQRGRRLEVDRQPDAAHAYRLAADAERAASRQPSRPGSDHVSRRPDHDVDRRDGGRSRLGRASARDLDAGGLGGVPRRS